MSKEYTIEIDCAPGNPRPGDLIEGVIKDTGLPTREPVSKVFGEWTWDYSDVPNIEEIWSRVQSRDESPHSTPAVQFATVSW